MIDWSVMAPLVVVMPYPAPPAAPDPSNPKTPTGEFAKTPPVRTDAYAYDSAMFRRLIVLGDLRRFAFFLRAMFNLLRKEAYNYHSND